MATDQPSVTRNQPGVTRKDFLRGVGAAGAGGLVVGGVGGFFGGRASASTEPAATAASTSKQPIVIGSGSPVTGVYAGDGQQMQRGQELAVAEINANGRRARPAAEARRARHPGPAAGRDEERPPEIRVAESGGDIRAVHHLHLGGVPDRRPGGHSDVSREHLARQRRFREAERDQEHLPGRPVGNLVRPGFRGAAEGPHRQDQAVDPVVEDDGHRHEQRPVQPEHRQDVPVRDAEASAGRPRCSSSSPCRRRTGPRRW